MCLESKLKKIDDLFNHFGCHRNDEGFEFSFTVNTENLQLLKQYIDAGVPLGIFQVGVPYVEFDELKLGNEVRAEITSQELRSAGLNVYLDWQAFFAYRPHLTEVPDSFLILSDHTIYTGSTPSTIVKHYFDVCDVLQLLISRAEHTKKMGSTIVEEIIFLHKNKLEITIGYDEKVFEDGMDGISIVKALFDDESHIEQKISILKEVLYSLLFNIPKAERLGYLLSHFGEFSKRLTENYQLYVSEFSFDDVRKEYEESKREYFTKLNDVFSSVQTKMLGIPISIAFASFKMSSIIDASSFWQNLLLALSIAIYSIMMMLMIQNQKHSLEAVKNDYESQMTRLKHHYSEQYDLIEGIQTDLNKRYGYQKKCLRFFLVMTICLFVLVLGAFIVNLNFINLVDVAFGVYAQAIN